MIYLAWGILSIFVLFGVIPSLVSMIGGNSYIECLKAGWVFFAAVAVILILSIAVLWAALYVMSH
jgi:hypothetical protein